MHGNNILLYYGILVNEEQYNIIKKVLTLEHRDYFKELLNTGKNKYIISGKHLDKIKDLTEYNNIPIVKKEEILNLLEDCEINEGKIAALDFKKGLAFLDSSYEQKKYKNYIENFLKSHIQIPAIIEIKSIDDLYIYCDTTGLQDEFDESFKKVEELAKSLNEYLDITPKLYMYKYSC